MGNPIITKKYHFSSSHKYGNEFWSDEKNYEVFGKDYDTHGHNYILEVSVQGPINPETGWLTDLQTLNKIVKESVVNILDHSQIELEVDWFKNKQPSTENMVVFMWNKIVDRIPSGAILHCIKLRETPTIFSEYYGPERK